MSNVENVDQPEPTAHNYINPEGDAPEGIPGPMPKDLQADPPREHGAMEGESPTS